MDNFSYL